jgi:hypothetical protein
MNHAKPLLMSVGAAALSERHPARMCLTAEQHSHIAAVYEKAGADNSLPAHTRAAFARKADWFRLVARVGEKRERAALIASEAKRNAPGITAGPVLVLGPARPRRWSFVALFTQS